MVFHVARRIIVEANCHNARVLPVRRLDKEMQIFKVVVIPRQHDQSMLNRMKKMARVRGTT